VCIVALTIAHGSPPPDPPAQPLDSPRSQTLLLLDQAIRQLARPSSDYVKVVTATLSAWPSTADNDAASGLRRFLARARKPGREFKCSDDFLRQRARQVVMNVRSAVHDGRARPLDADVCYASPAALDVTESRSLRGNVDVYGFDLDTVMPELVLVNDDGARDVSEALNVVSHDHLVIDLDRARPSITSKSLSLAVTWGHLIRYSVPLVHETTRLCEAKVETVPSTTVTYASAAPRTRAGRISVDLTIDYSLNKLDATICVASGDPEVDGCSTEFVHTIDPDFVIEGVLGPVHSEIDLTQADRSAGTSQTGHGAVTRWVIPGRTPESGLSDGLIAARLESIRVISARDYACISPITYLEARRTTRFQSRTRRLLDDQLKAVDTRILKRRPRFAPQ
jgi:hypothetical protein